MSSLLAPVKRASIQDVQQEIRSHVRRAIAETQFTYSGQERRRNPRVPFPYPVYLTPLDSDGNAEPEKSFTVLGRHLSDCGLDFYHSQPVTSRKLIASLDSNGERAIGFVMELTWCRFGRHGWYENGGRFVSVAQPPFCDG